jgi:hypothetical protein
MIGHALDPEPSKYFQEGAVGVGEHVGCHVAQSAGIMKDFVKDKSVVDLPLWNLNHI